MNAEHLSASLLFLANLVAQSHKVSWFHVVGGLCCKCQNKSLTYAVNRLCLMDAAKNRQTYPRLITSTP